MRVAAAGTVAATARLEVLEAVVGDGGRVDGFTGGLIVVEHLRGHGDTVLDQLLDVFGTNGTDGARDDGTDSGCDFADKGLGGLGTHDSSFGL